MTLLQKTTKEKNLLEHQHSKASLDPRSLGNYTRKEINNNNKVKMLFWLINKSMNPVLPQSTHTLLPPLFSVDYNPPDSMKLNSAWVLELILSSTSGSTILTYYPGVHWVPYSPSLLNMPIISHPTFQLVPLIHPLLSICIYPPPSICPSLFITGFNI